jgi:hypothetical protein
MAEDGVGCPPSARGFHVGRIWIIVAVTYCRQFPRAEFGLIQRQIDNPAADGLWDAVPDPIRP